MDQWALDLGFFSGISIELVLAIIAGCLLFIVLVGAIGTQLRYGGILKKVGRSALLWSVVGCDVGPAINHKSSLFYWRVGYWRVAGRPDLLLKHRLLPIIDILEIKSRSKALPSPYEFLQVQVYLSAAGQAFPWLFKNAYIVYPVKTVKISRSWGARRLLKRVLMDVDSYLANGLAPREQQTLERLVSKSISQ